jgi:DNA-binding transcriptional LysR family regulator
MPKRTSKRGTLPINNEFRLPGGYVIARRVDLLQMWYAVATAQHGSMRRAAVMLNVRQPTLSRKIQDLETEIGITLFERSTGGAFPTRVGRNFVRDMEHILLEIDEMVVTARSIGRGDAGQLRVGFSTSLSAGNLRATLMEFTHRFPDVEISAIEGSRARLSPALQSGRIDIAIVTGEVPPISAKAMPLWTERIIVALPEAHPLAAHDIVHWTDLKDEKLLLSQHQAAPEIMDILISKLASPDDRPNLVQYDVSRGDIQGLVAAGFGVSLMCEAAVGFNCSGVAYREARDGTGSTRVGYTGYWDDANENPALKNFIKLLEERYPPLPNGAADPRS